MINNTFITTLNHWAFINKKFRDMPDVRKRLISSIEVNPFPTMDVQSIIDAEMNRDITKEDAVLAIYSNFFVQTASEADDTFLDKPFEEQMKIVTQMAAEKTKELKPTLNAIPEPPSPTELP